jgi:glucose/arabinose dehydrogenase
MDQSRAGSSRAEMADLRRPGLLSPSIRAERWRRMSILRGVGRTVTGLALVGSVLTGGPGDGRGFLEAATPAAPAQAGGPTILAAARSTQPAVAVAPSSYTPGHLSLKLVRIAGGFTQPLFLTNARDGSFRQFVVEQGGRIKIIDDGVTLATPFLDIHTRVTCCGERGLLGLAFHPSYKTNGKFYVNYTDLNGNTVVAEYLRSSTNSNRANTIGRVLLRVTQPYANHNGGMLAFGPDGYLYIGLGDGGSSGDPGNRAQSLGTLLGKILRIDVNRRTGTLQYGIPATNPFVGRTGDDRIWSYGLRNPWRFSFDKSTGDLWIGDVGQNRYEEVDRATRASGGGRGRNYGWRVMEGRACYSPPTGCNTSGKTMPLAVYSHTYGCSVTGGYVYRGSQYPAMQGAYLFADYCSGRIWAVVAGGASSQTPRLLLDTSHSISSFGETEGRNLVITDLASGEIFKLTGSYR